MWHVLLSDWITVSWFEYLLEPQIILVVFILFINYLEGCPTRRWQNQGMRVEKLKSVSWWKNKLLANVHELFTSMDIAKHEKAVHIRRLEFINCINGAQDLHLRHLLKNLPQTEEYWENRVKNIFNKTEQITHTICEVHKFVSFYTISI